MFKIIAKNRLLSPTFLLTMKINFHFIPGGWSELLFFHRDSNNKEESKNNSSLAVLMIDIQIH